MDVGDAAALGPETVFLLLLGPPEAETTLAEPLLGVDPTPVETIFEDPTPLVDAGLDEDYCPPVLIGEDCSPDLPVEELGPEAVAAPETGDEAS